MAANQPNGANDSSKESTEHESLNSDDHQTSETESNDAKDPDASANAVTASEGSAASTEATASRPAQAKSRWSGLAWLGQIGINAAVFAGVGVGLIVLLGVAQRTGWISAADDAAADVQHVHDGKTVYTCPMHPQIRMDGPGNCPICKMKLVLVSSGQPDAAAKENDRYICPMMCTPASNQEGRCPVCAMQLVPATSGAGDGTSTTIDPVSRRLVGIRTAEAKSQTVFQTIRTIGRINYDESKLATISAYVEGRLEKMYADYVGVSVGENDDLALLYSPQLYSAQVEYLATLNGGVLSQLGFDDEEPISVIARENLTELGMTESQIDQLDESRKANSRSRIKSPLTGTVIEKRKVEGDYVKTGEVIYSVADLSTVWMMLDLYPDDASRIRFGQQVEAEVQSMPGQVFAGRVAFIDPTVDQKTRTVSVRVEMFNPDGSLRPGDYATARISAPAVRQQWVYDPVLAGKYISPMHPQIILDAPGDCPVCGMDLIPTTELGYATEPIPEQKVITIPRQAVLMAGKNSVVYVESEPGRFETRRVSVGPMTDTDAIIIEGISEGETVATDGNFLIDSQMQLAGNPSLMDPSRASVYPSGPLSLPKIDPQMLSGDAAKHFDRAYEAYFVIQKTLADDKTPPPIAVNTLADSLEALLSSSDVPDSVQIQLNRARGRLTDMQGSIDESRRAFRVISHAMLRAAALARGPATAEKLVHFHCPMVPGGGGDWMQADEDLLNPYWGSEMLQCGEQVADMKLGE